MTSEMFASVGAGFFSNQPKNPISRELVPFSQCSPCIRNFDLILTMDDKWNSFHNIDRGLQWLDSDQNHTNSSKMSCCAFGGIHEEFCITKYWRTSQSRVNQEWRRLDKDSTSPC